MNGVPWLTVLILTPAAGAVLVPCLGAKRRLLAPWLGLIFGLLAAVVAAKLWLEFDGGSAELQFVERHPWITTPRVEYCLGLDGLGLLMVLLSAFVVPFAMLASWRVQERTGLYFALLLLLQAGLFGAFTALNFFHWFLFWELSLVPAYFLIRLWGGSRRLEAATQFFVYTLVGSVTLLLAFLALYYATGLFDFSDLAELARNGGIASALFDRLGRHGLFDTKESLALFIFLLAFLGFAVKVPLFPFHTWLPLTYAEAPTGVTMVLTGAMSKLGVYGFLRILLPIFPAQMRQILTPLLWLAVASIVLSAFAAFAQKDLKRMLAYSSVNHLGYCLLGVFAVLVPMTDGVGGAALKRWETEQAAALNGVLLQMFNHGVTASALFCFVGFLEQRSGGLRGLDDFGGVRKVAPVFAGLMGIALFASLGLPGLNGFVGEFLIFKGTFSLVSWAAALAAIGLLVTAVFLLTIVQRVFSGPLGARWSTFADLTTTERWIVVPATVMIFALGVYPQLVIGLVNQTVLQWVEQLK
jgi:NADH-quinone oxidoreductase subunit M